jgi:hypothetical protein
MSKATKALLVSVGFLILWVGWCFLAIHVVLHILLFHINMDTRFVGPLLCALPFLLYAGGLIAWFRSADK